MHRGVFDRKLMGIQSRFPVFIVLIDPNLIKIRPLHLLPILYPLITSRSEDCIDLFILLYP